MNDTMVINIEEAPSQIREEIEKLRGSVHSMETLDSISKEAKKWILSQADKNNGSFEGVIKRAYAKTIVDVRVNVLGIEMLERFVGKDMADEMNLDLYNACAEFVREYNKVKLSES